MADDPKENGREAMASRRVAQAASHQGEIVSNLDGIGGDARLVSILVGTFENAFAPHIEDRDHRRDLRIEEALQGSFLRHRWL
ncbi:hypothetical protein D9M68_452820 [compost metagenome]